MTIRDDSMECHLINLSGVFLYCHQFVGARFADLLETVKLQKVIVWISRQIVAAVRAHAAVWWSGHVSVIRQIAWPIFIVFVFPIVLIRTLTEYTLSPNTENERVSSHMLVSFPLQDVAADWRHSHQCGRVHWIQQHLGRVNSWHYRTVQSYLHGEWSQPVHEQLQQGPHHIPMTYVFDVVALYVGHIPVYLL